MKREEEIQKLIDKEMGVDNYGSSDYQVGVCDGVKFADKTMIEKVCEWLKENIDKDLVIYNNQSWTKRDVFIDKLKKAMEE